MSALKEPQKRHLEIFYFLVNIVFEKPPRGKSINYVCMYVCMYVFLVAIGSLLNSVAAECWKVL